MSLTRANPTGWGVNDPFTSTQANAMDINTSNAVDKRAGALEIASQDFVTWVPPTPILTTKLTFDSTGTPPNDPGRPYWYQSDVSGVAQYLTELFPRANGTLKSVRIYMDGDQGGTGSHSAFPATMPTFKLYKYNRSSDSTTLLQSVASVANGNFGDGPTNFANTIANYDATWNVLLSNAGAGFGDLSHETDKGILLSIMFEAGANSRVGLMLFGIKCTWTCTTLRPGG